MQTIPRTSLIPNISIFFPYSILGRYTMGKRQAGWWYFTCHRESVKGVTKGHSLASQQRHLFYSLLTLMRLMMMQSKVDRIMPGSLVHGICALFIFLVPLLPFIKNYLSSGKIRPVASELVDLYRTRRIIVFIIKSKTCFQPTVERKWREIDLESWIIIYIQRNPTQICDALVFCFSEKMTDIENLFIHFIF